MSTGKDKGVQIRTKEDRAGQKTEKDKGGQRGQKRTEQKKGEQAGQRRAEEKRGKQSWAKEGKAEG